jgi:hypothetical protein
VIRRLASDALLLLLLMAAAVLVPVALSLVMT